MVELWTDAEQDILTDIARIIANYDYATPAAQKQVQLLRATGATQKAIRQALSAITGKSEAEIKRLMQTAGDAVVQNESDYYKAADVYKATAVNTKALNKVLNQGTQATLADLRTIIQNTVTVGSSQVYTAIDRAQLLVSTGAMSQESAIKSAIKQLAQAGLGTTVTYQKNGRITQRTSIEAAVRRAVQTGVNQTALKISDELADELECDLVEVSAHEGARPSHALWQGRIYSRSGKSEKYPKLSTATGYGTITGLGGINCRHTFGPYVEGMSRTYTDEYLQQLQDSKVTYNGKEMSEYEATQVQRYQERQIRRYKREAAMCEAVDDEAGAAAANARVQEWRAKQQSFTRQTGLRRQYERENIVTIAPTAAQATENRV